MITKWTKEYKKEYHREYSKKWREKNKEYLKKYYQKNREHLCDIKKKWQKENPEKVKIQAKKYRQKNKEKIEEYKERWQKENPGKWKEIKAKSFQRNKEKLYKRRRVQRSNIVSRLNNSMANLIWRAIRENKGGQKWESLVGYTLKDLILHLEVKFDENMNWNNYGNYWWIDHIKPRSLFNYILPEDPQFQECWALKNLQPLEKIENIKKSNKY